MSACIEQAIVRVCQSIATVFWDTAEQDADFPHIVGRTITGAGYGSSDEPEQYSRTTVQLDFYSLSGAERNLSSRKLRDALLKADRRQSFKSGIVTLHSVQLVNKRSSTETEASQRVFVQSQDFSILFKEE